MKRSFEKIGSIIMSAALVLAASQMSAVTANAAVDVDSLEDGTAYLSINNTEWSDFEAEYTNVLITGNGQYTVSMEAKEAQDLVQFNALQVKNGESAIGNASILTVDEIKINGEVIELQGNSYTCSADGAGIDTRVNLYNEWNSPIGEDGNPSEDFRSLNDAADTTATLWSTELQTGVQSVEVTFTVSDYGKMRDTSEEDTASAASDVDLDGTYHAYIGLQSPNFTFRNAWDDGSYGAAVENGKYFNQLTGWEGNDAVTVAGTFTDAEIKGNGSYSVSANGIEWPDGEFDNQDYMNLIFISTDIPNTGAITISDVELLVNGSKVDLASAGAILSPDNVNYINILLQNIWNEDVATIGYYSTPFTDIQINFTVSGFNYDQEALDSADTAQTETAAADTAEAAETTTEESAQKSGNGGLVAGIIAVIVVLAAICGFVVYRKKNNKY